jgi:transketolase
MRVPFVEAVHRVLQADPQSVFLTGDLGYNAFEKLAATFGPRFLNVGVAEQNMMGVAAGMAMTGLRPWVYSIAPFGTYRCLEQIRNDVCLHDLPVRIVGNGGGYTYGIMGSTHHALEDLACLKPLPNMRLFYPCSNNHVEAAVARMNELSGPSYLRLSISGFQSDAAPLSENPKTLTRRYAARSSKSARAVTIVAAGHAAQIVSHALVTAKDLDVDVFGLATFPFDWESDRDVAESVEATRRVLLVEEHYASGGIGESFAASFAGKLDSFTLLAAAYRADQHYGSPAFHLKQCGLTPDAVVSMARTLLAS